MHVVASPLTEIRNLYGRGLFLQAHHVGKELGALVDWPGTEGRVLAGRLAANLGAIKLTRVLQALAHRRDPKDWEARYYFVFRLMDRHGPLRTWRFLEAHGDPGDDVPSSLRADWCAIRAQVLAMVRDFESAEQWQSRAESLAPDRPWIWVERSSLCERQDRMDEAVEAARHALQLNALYRPAIQHAAHLLATTGRDEESLSLLRDASERMESGHVWVQRGMLESELGMHQDAAASFERAIACFPLMDKSYAQWLYARLADEAYEIGDRPLAIQFARKVETEIYTRFADSMESSDKSYRRKILPVGFVRQEHVTCGPATLASICKYWNRPVDHLQVVERICYDGTPAHSERQWAEDNGFVAREFTVTWDAVRELIDRGCPFTLTTVGTAAGHLQAAIGYDECRRSLTVRDPSTRILAEFDLDALLKTHRLTGPRGMTMVPLEEAHRLEGLDLPEMELYDQFYAVQRALDRHDRTSASQAADLLQATAPDHRITLFARRAVANYDSDSTTGLSIVEALLQQFPDDVNLQMSRFGYLHGLASRETRLEVLREKYRSSKTDPIFWRFLAQELSDDAREWPEAKRILKRLLRYRRDDAAGYRALANILWNESHKKGLIFYRWASCLDDKNEDYARSYFIACRHLKSDDGYRLLLDRFKRFNRRSAWPTRTLCWALTELERDTELLQVLGEALEHRPDDGDLLIYAADAYCRLNRVERGLELLERARTRVHRGSYLRAKARLAGYRGELQEALALWQEAASLDPLAADAHAAVAGLLHDCENLPAALAYLREVVQRFPFNIPIQQLLIEWLRAGDPTEAETALRNLLKLHPADAWTHRELALTLCKAGRASEALTYAKAAQELDPATSATFLTLARVRHLLGERGPAIADYRQALRLSVDSTIAIEELMRICHTDEERRSELDFVRGELVRQTTFGDGLLSFREQAQGVLDAETLLQTLRDAHAARPDLWHSWTALVMQLVDMQQFEEAHQLATGATERFPLLPRVWFDLANVCAARSDDDGEVRALEQALAINPSWGYVSRRIAEFYEKRGDKERARAVLEQAVARDPSDGINRGCLADALWNAGEHDRAIEQLLRALRLSPGYEWGWDAVGRWLRELGREAELIKLAETIASDRPGEARSWMVLSRVQAEQGLVTEALASLNRAIALNPILEDAHEQRARLLADQGKLDEALDACAAPVWGDHVPVSLRGRAADIVARKGDIADAIRQMQAVLADNPDYYWGWYRLAEWLDGLGRGEEYLHASRELARCAPNWAVSHGFLGDAERRFGDQDLAIKSYEKAFELEPTYVFAGHQLADMLAESAPDRAREVLSKMRSVAPSPGVARHEVELGQQLDDQPMVLRAFQELCHSADDEGQLVVCARKLQKSPSRGQLLKILEECLAGPQPNPNLGAALMNFQNRIAVKVRWLKQHDAGNQVWRRACLEVLNELCETPNVSFLQKLINSHRARLVSDLDLWATTGRALYASNLYKRAIEWLSDWQTRDGVAPWMMGNLVLAHWCSNQVLAARDAAEAALRLPRDHVTDIHCILLAAAEAVSGDPAKGARVLQDANLPSLNDYYHALGRLVEAALAELTAPAAQRGTVLAVRHRLIQAMGTSRGLLQRDHLAYLMYRRLMAQIAAKRDNLLMKLWYTLWRLRIS